MAVQIQLRRGTAAQWTSANPTLASGEVGYETDTNKEKIGDGTTSWNSLAYFGGGSPGGSTTQVQFNSSGSFAGDANLTFSGSTLTSANLIVSNLSTSQAVFSSSTKQLVSNPITGTGSVVMNSSPVITSPTLITPALGSPASGNMAATTNIPVANATGTLAVANGGTGVTVSTGSGSVVLNTSPTLTTPTLISPVLGTPTSGSLVATSNIPVANATGTLAVANGGTGLTSTPANGALDIGNGTGFTRTTLTAGTNVTITNGSGSITIAASGGSGSPAGSNTQIQYNNSGAFGASSTFIYDGTNLGLGVSTASGIGSGYTTMVMSGSTGSGLRFFRGATSNSLVYGDANGLYLQTAESLPIQFLTANVEAMRVTTNGTVILKGASTSATGVGITFPATQSASTDVNTLDDYEEGTWTGSVGGTATYSAQSGRYTKIGRMVYVQIDLNILLIGTGSTTVITGLPFATSGQVDVESAISIANFSGIATNVVFMNGFAINSEIRLRSLTAAGATVSANAIFANSTAVELAGWYQTTT